MIDRNEVVDTQSRPAFVFNQPTDFGNVVTGNVLGPGITATVGGTATLVVP
ncbi:MAG: hypothetical protein AAFX94_22120 [Myxococcota bacterium]